MSESDWYRNKAAECERMADSATDPAVRAQHVRDQKNWIEIAKNIEAVEEAVKIDANKIERGTHQKD